jgi:hypothetical protein
MVNLEFSRQFEEIRPYYDHEVKAAIERVVKHPQFVAVLNYLYENENVDELVQVFNRIETVVQFQDFFSSYTVKRIIELSSGGLSFQGLENLDPEKSYLFIANHRDIVLDAAIMQIMLLDHGHKTSQITFGENLMSQQLLVDLGKLNKMFTFYRGGSRNEQYNNARLYSAYFEYVIQERNESVWIAQRNGRAKDGNDKTQAGLIKMLTVGKKDIGKALAGLNILPVTISYEKEPCAILKARELYLSRDKEYVKGPNEDIMSILEGITGDKGRIHFSFGKPLNDFIETLAINKLNKNELIERIVEEIDIQVYSDYRLWPNNYIAFDILNNSRNYGDQYSEKEKRIFTEDMNTRIGELNQFNSSEIESLFLQIYARPVINKEISSGLLEK